MQVIGTGKPRLAGSLATSVLMDEDTAQRTHLGRDPEREVGCIGQSMRRVRGLVAHPVVRAIRRWEDVVGRLLGQNCTNETEKQDKKAAHGVCRGCPCLRAVARNAATSPWTAECGKCRASPPQFQSRRLRHNSKADPFEQSRAKPPSRLCFQKFGVKLRVRT